VKGASLSLNGVFGTEGIVSKIDSAVTCKTDMEISGNFSGKMGKLGSDSSDDSADSE